MADPPPGGGHHAPLHPGERCLMQLLQEALDDPSAAPCGRCSACLGRLPDGVPARRRTRSPARWRRCCAAATTSSTRGSSGRAARFGSRKRIPPDRQAAKGRALAFADAPEWRGAHRRRVSPATPPPRRSCLDAVRRPAERLARRVAGAPRGGGGPPRRRVPGADGRAWSGHIAAAGRLPSADAPGAAAAGRRPDLRRRGRPLARRPRPPRRCPPRSATAWCCWSSTPRSTLWPVTVATATLREAGAAKVLPLIIHRRP